MPVMPALKEPSGDRPRKGERTAERILEAAEQLFAERGYAGATLRDVANEVGIRIPSLYNHFESKESLYAAVLERGISPVLQALNEFIEEGGPASADSTRMIERAVELLADHPHLPKLVQHEILTGGERMNPLLREWIRPAFSQAQTAIEASPAAHQWKTDQIPLLVLAMYHVIIGYFTIAPFYKELNGVDLTKEEALANQVRFCGELVRLLLPQSDPSQNPEGKRK